MDPPAVRYSDNVYLTEVDEEDDLEEGERREDPPCSNLLSDSDSNLLSDSEDHDEAAPTSGDDHETGSDRDDVRDNNTLLSELAADLLKQNDPSRMQLTKEERQWALAIKDAIENIPDLDCLSDFFCCQLAIVCGDDIDMAIDKAFRHQKHKQENKILDTVEDALRNLPKDRSWISVDFNLQTGSYISAVDMTGVDMSIWKDPDAICYFNRRMYYGTTINFPDFAAMRNGSTLLCECEGYQVGGGAMLTLKRFRSIWENFYAYPKKLTDVKFFNSPTMFTVMLSIAKAALPKELASKFQLVPKCPLGRLDRVYSLPTPEIARERLKERMKSLARKRYANEKSFRLVPVPEPSPSNTLAFPMLTVPTNRPDEAVTSRCKARTPAPCSG